MKPLPVLAGALLAPGNLQWSDFVCGTSGLKRLDNTCPVPIGAPVPGIDALPAGFPHPSAPRPLLLALEVARRLRLEEGPNYGLVLGLSSLYPEPAYVEHALQNLGPERMADMQAYRGDFALEYLAGALGVTGPRIRLDSACATGSDALILAHQWIERDWAEDVLVVAAASMLNPIGLALFRNLRALTEEDDLEASRPFDRRRRGFVMGEGAAALWLSGRRPDAPIGYVCSYGQSMNAFKMTDMPTDLTAMEQACRQALGPVEDLAYISAHGTSTPANDVCEARLYRKILGERWADVPISSLKSMTGHCLGASSLIEVLVCFEALRARRAPPTAHLREPDPECCLNFVPLEAQAIEGEFALSNAFAFGGHNSSVLLSRQAPC
jgi:3-oxoacyl-[acyl-carrier-protein] synthase II